MSQTPNDKSAPPRGIKVNRDADGEQTVYEVILTLPRYRYWISGLALGVPLVIMLTALLDSETWWLAVFIVAVEAATGLVFLPDLLRRREIEVNHGYMTLTDYARYIGPKSETLTISEISGMEIGSARLNIGHEILVEADGETHRIGAGLSKDTLSWLRNYLTNALREAAATGTTTRFADRLHRGNPAATGTG